MGSGLEGLAPLCGQLTRCFSAVAELLVLTNTILSTIGFSHNRPNPNTNIAMRRLRTNSCLSLAVLIKVLPPTNI